MISIRPRPTIFAIGHPDTYRALVIDGEWTGERWAQWARTTLHSALIPSPADDPIKTTGDAL